jgi:hypothetical protein
MWLAVLGVACGRAQGVGPQSATPESAPAGIVVQVINDNYYDARIRLIYDGGLRRSLGTIGGNGGQAKVTVPWQPRALVVEVTLVIGGGVYRSDRIHVSPGDVLEVRVPANLESSGFFRRVRG